MLCFFWAWNENFEIIQRRLDPGMDTPSQKPEGISKSSYNTIFSSRKMNIFCIMHKGVVQILSLPYPLENLILNGHKSVDFKAKNFSFQI